MKRFWCVFVGSFIFAYFLMPYDPKTIDIFMLSIGALLLGIAAKPTKRYRHLDD